MHRIMLAFFRIVHRRLFPATNDVVFCQPMKVDCRLECWYEFIPRDSDQGFFTRVWLDYENKTSVNKMKENEKT